MGRDKALLALGDKTFLERALAATVDAGRVVLVGPRREVADDRCVWTREDPPGTGPVAAIARGIDLVSSKRVVLLAVDHPLVDASVIDGLLTASAGHDGAIVIDAQGRGQPLVGVYRTASLRERLTEMGVVGGAAISSLVSGLTLRHLVDDRAARDCDSPEDLAALEHDHSHADGDVSVRAGLRSAQVRATRTSP